MKNLEQIAKDFFGKNKDVEQIYITDEGFVFINRNAAELHAKSNPGGKKLGIKTFNNPGASQEPEKKTADERIAAIEAAKSIEEVENLLKGEKAKTVKEAGQKKIEALTIAAEQAAENGSPENRNENQNPDA